MTWVNGPFLGFDCESTSVDPEEARAVQFAVVRVASPTVIEKMSWTVNPGVDIPEEATAIHGISNEQARESLPTAEILPIVTAVLRDAWESDVPVVCYNAPYDLTLLDSELRRNGMPPLTEIGHVIDPFVISNTVAAWKRPHTLERACETFNIPWAGKAHDAEADAFMACRLAWRMGNDFRALVQSELGSKVTWVGDIPLNVLDELQAEWYRKNAESYIADQRTKGREPEGVNTAWPIIPKPHLASK